MILFDDIVEILRLTDLNRRLLLSIAALNGRLIRSTLIDRNLLRRSLTLDRLAQKAQGGRAIPVGREQEIRFCRKVCFGRSSSAILPDRKDTGRRDDRLQRQSF